MKGKHFEMNRIPDSEVSAELLKIKNGDVNALSKLYDLTANHLYAVCYSYMRNRQDAEDALSEVYLKVMRHINKFNGKSGFNWLYTIAKNTCLNNVKKREREVTVDFADEKTVNLIGAAYTEEITVDDESGIVEIAKRVLKDKEFRTVILHAVCGYSFKEIAGMDSTVEATVRWRYNNAIKKIRKAYGQGGGNERL